MKKWLLSFVLAGSFALGQGTAPPPGGFETEWDLRKLLESLSAEGARLKPMLDKADPKKWDDAGATASYMPQWNSAQNEIQYLGRTADLFSKQPERVTLALETFFRLESLERTLGSFTEGLRRYGNPAVADLLDGSLRENSTNRERLRQYLSELAKTREEEYQIMDKEAQRCRATITRQTPPPPERGKKVRSNP